MYSEKVMDHFEHPRNVGEIENASGVGTVGNAKCGDIMRIYLDIDDNQIIRDVKFKTFGCGAAVATSSMATEMVKGKTIEEAMQITNKAVMEALDGLPPQKITNQAHQSAKNINKVEKGMSGTDEANRAKKVEEAYKNASHAKAGSITAKANLVRDFEERNKKK